MLSRIAHWFSRFLVFLSTFVVVLLAGAMFLIPVLIPDNRFHTNANKTFSDVAKALGIDESGASRPIEAK